MPSSRGSLPWWGSDDLIISLDARRAKCDAHRLADLVMRRLASGEEGEVRSRPTVYKLIRTLEGGRGPDVDGQAGRAELRHAPEFSAVLSGS